jgi:dolichyl-phosphate-mannose-protein mannosyltransferase
MTARPPLRATILIPVVLTLAAAGIRVWGLGSPAMPYWDEQHYVYDANAYLGGGFGLEVGNPPAVRIADEGTWVHPPLGKWAIALLGVGPLGLDPVGWRVPSVLFGVAGVLLLYLLALQLWGSAWWAGLAGGLLALDGLHIVQSRLAMLDIFLTTFITGGVLFLVMDRKRMDGPIPAEPIPAEEKGRLAHRIFGSPQRFWAGVMLGAAVATKWAGMFALAFAIVLLLVWVLSGRERSRGSLGASLGTIAISMILVPAVVYLLSYGAFFAQHGPAIHDFAILQLRMLQYHQHHTQIQPQNSLPWTWPLLLHPIRYFDASRSSSVSEIVAVGNPAVWWGFLLLLPVAAVGAVRRPRWQDAVVFGGYVAMFVPWLYIGRSQFIFYLLPAVPFMCLGIVASLRKLPSRAARRAAIGTAVVVAMAAVAFAPVWVGGWVPSSWVEHLRLLHGWPI